MKQKKNGLFSVWRKDLIQVTKIVDLSIEFYKFAKI